MKKAIVLGLLLSVALLTGVLAALPKAGGQAEALQRDGVVMFPQPLPVSDFRFISEQGISVSQQDLKGHKLLVFFGYTFCPDICPTTLMDLGRTWKQLPAEIRRQWQVVLVSVDPQRDTPQVLAPYVGYFNKEFSALTGNPKALVTLAAELNAVYQKVDRGPDSPYLMDHSANLALLDEEGRYIGYIAPPHHAARMVPLLKALSVPQS